ncbi:hypothetical protein BSKO_04786 [Bryopsis sp. KO-2023]|nr:hypothetical protein BSKO_04786 [Bryopsis sp. KO-2023]
MGMVNFAVLLLCAAVVSATGVVPDVVRLGKLLLPVDGNSLGTSTGGAPQVNPTPPVKANDPPLLVGLSAKVKQGQLTATLSAEQTTPLPSPPSPSPTPAPLPTPTPAPTTSPTPVPTTSPTPVPTTSPTPAPTTSPTPAPTTSPTPAPTTSPTPAPTTSPTPAPTTSPTPAPTTSPTPAPTTPTAPAPTTISGTNIPDPLSGSQGSDPFALPDVGIFKPKVLPVIPPPIPTPAPVDLNLALSAKVKEGDLGATVEVAAG